MGWGGWGGGAGQMQKRENGREKWGGGGDKIVDKQ